MSEGTYSKDLAFLANHTHVVELTCFGSQRVAVAPAWQGRVMTSSLAAGGGMGFGWINRGFIESGRRDEQFNNYGGEDRFWLGPEAGQFGLWFGEGEPFDTDHWKTPGGFDAGAFKIDSMDAGSVAMRTEFDVTNYSGTTFRCAATRTIRALASGQAATVLGAEIPAGAAMVGFESDNTVTNAGDEGWTRRTGLLSIWTLGMFKPSPRGAVIVPFAYGDEKTLGPKATTDYFGPVPAERCTIADDHLLFSCDGTFRSKIGISPVRAKDALGSYDPDGGVLTIVQFNLPRAAARLPYVNSRWEIQDDPYAGDVINSYNDGEPKPGAGQLGPFYELETSSPAAELKPGESINHVHRTFHFSGEFDLLSDLAVKVLGVGLERIRRRGIRVRRPARLTAPRRGRTFATDVPVRLPRGKKGRRRRDETYRAADADEHFRGC